MNLLIISHTPHYRDDGTLKGWGATIREIDHLSRLFDQVVHIAPLYTSQTPASSLAYKAPNVRVVPIRPSGGDGWIEKLFILINYPAYAAAILRELFRADVVHIRAPANIALIAMVLLAFVRHPKKRWIKYAGNWKPDSSDAWSYRFQRWWLRRGWHRGLVTVNGEWPDSPEFVHSFLNPCLTEAQLAYGEQVAATKELALPLRIVFVGRIEAAKGVGRILEIAKQLVQAGVTFEMDLIGDGPQRTDFEASANENGLAKAVHFHGWQERDQIDTFYARAHFILFPSSSSEGWPKVLSEAMAYGAVPLASNISSIPQHLARHATGRAFDAGDSTGFASALKDYLERPEQWKAEAQNSVRAARDFSYANYLRAVSTLLGISLPA